MGTLERQRVILQGTAIVLQTNSAAWSTQEPIIVTPTVVPMLVGITLGIRLFATMRRVVPLTPLLTLEYGG